MLASPAVTRKLLQILVVASGEPLLPETQITAGATAAGPRLREDAVFAEKH